jgi:hypothetical protein
MVSTSLNASYTAGNAKSPWTWYVMTDVMLILIVDSHPSIGKLAVFRNQMCILVESTGSEFPLRLKLLWVKTDSSTRSPRNALYNYRCLGCDITFHGI